MNSFRIMVSGVLCASALAVAQPALAGPRSGSGTLISNRDCSGVAPADPCGGAPIYMEYAGGARSEAHSTAFNMNGTGANGAVRADFGNGFLPNLGVAAFSTPTTRVSANAFAFQTYTYSGTQAVDLALNGFIDYWSSGTRSDGLSYEEPGGSLLQARLRLMPVALLDTLADDATGEQIYNWFYRLGNCANGDIGGAVYNSFSTAPGFHEVTLGLSTRCNGEAITINPGDTFVVAANMSGIANRDGFMDAMNTFRVAYDPDKTVFTGTNTSVGAGFFATNFAAMVPEPASWALMITGFGAVGGAMRRRAKARPSLRLA